MNIKMIEIEGRQMDFKITRTETGATVTVQLFSRSQGTHDKVIAEIANADTRDARFNKCIEIVKIVNGSKRADHFWANSVLTHIDRIVNY